MQNKLRKLLTITVLSLSAVVLLLLFTTTQALAAEDTDTTTATNAGDGGTLNFANRATHVAGRSIANGIDTIIIDSAAGALVFGAVGADDALSVADNTNNAIAFAITASSNAGTNSVTFAGDIDLAGANDQLTFNVTNTNTVFQGDIGTGEGTTPTVIPDIVIGGGSGSGKVLSATFDTASVGNQLIWAEIVAKHADDTITLAITNTNGTVTNAQTFNSPNGGGVAIDAVTIGAATNVTFAAALGAGTITVNSERTTSFDGAVTGAINIATTATPTLVFGNGVGVSGAINNTSGSAGVGTLTIEDSGNATKVFGGIIGGSNSLLAINAVIAGVNAAAITFSQNVSAVTMNFTGDADNTDIVIASGDLTGAITITTGGTIAVAADKKVVGSVVTSGNDVGVVNFAAATADTVLSNGAMGTAAGDKLAIIAVITSASNAAKQTFASTVDATLINVTGTGTLEFLGAVTTGTLTQSTANFTTFAVASSGILDLTAASSTATLAANIGWTGTINSSSNSVGTVTFTATTADTTYVTSNVGATGTGLDAINVAPGTVSSVQIVGGFGGTVQADLLTHSGTGDVQFTGATDITTLTITGDGTATWKAGVGHTGNVTTDGTTEGTLVFKSGTQNISGTTGATANRIKQITKEGAGVLTLTGHVFATDTTISTLAVDVGAISMAVGALLTSDLHFGVDGGIKIGTGITGTITTYLNEKGTITTLADSATITGAIGASGTGIKLLDVNHNLATTEAIYAKDVDIASTKTLTAAKTITGDVNFSDDGFLILSGDGANIVGTVTNSATDGTDGKITTSATHNISGNIGTLLKTLLEVDILTGDKLTVGGDIYATTTSLASASELTFSHATAVATEDIVCGAACKVDVGTATVTTTGAFTLSGASTFKVTIGTTDGKLVSSGLATTATTTIIHPTIAGTVTSGESLLIIDGTGALAILPTATIVDNYERYNFAVASCGGSTQDICLTATIVAPAGVSSNSAAVSAIADGAFASDATMANAINGLSGAALDKALTTLSPSVDGGAIVGSISAGSASGATISTQIASLRSGIAAGRGLNAGDGANEKRFWTQGFGTSADQDVREKINGFKSTTGGVALGVDKRVRPDTVVGVAYSFSHTDVDTKESKSGTKVKGHQATFYGTHDFDRGVFGTDGVFVDGQLSYAYNDYSGARYIEVGAVTRKADSEFDGSQMTTKFDLGKTVNFADKLRFTPTAGLSYTHVSVDKFTETGAGDSSLALKKQDYDILNLNIRGKLSRTWEVNGADVTPEMHVGYSYEAIHDKIQTTSNFTGGGASFISTGFKPANHTYSGGVGLTFGASDKMPVDLTFTYDFSGKDDFESHSGLVKGAWKF